MLVDKLFVYGLLKEGLYNFPLIEPYIITSKDAFVYGSLYELKNAKTPAFINKGDNKVHGKLYFLMDTRNAFKILDYLEDGFKRKLIDVYTSDGNEHKAWIYVYQNDLNNARIIEEGIWNKSEE